MKCIIAKVQKQGYSFKVTIPIEWIRENKIKKGDLIKIELHRIKICDD